MDTSSDPWDWTVDEVIQEFCNARTIWRVGHPNARLPDPVLFERLLRENDVEGSTLLTDLGPGELKDDFGIKSLGQRSVLMWGIGQLRSRSEKYLANQQSSARLQQVIKSESQPPTPFRSFSATPGHSFSPGLATIKDSPISLSARREEEPAASGSESAQPVVTNNAKGTRELQTGLNESFKRQGSPSHERPENGKKRRLNLAPPVPLPKVSTPATQSQPSSSTTTSLIELPKRTRLSSIKSETLSYLGPSKLTPDDIFFGSGGLGEPLNADIDMRPLTEDGTESSDFQICLADDRTIPGRQRYVYRQVVHFLRQPRLDVKRHGMPAMAIFPYNQSTSMVSDTRSALVFTSKDGGIEAIRERAAGLLGGTSQDESLATNSNHEWDFLLQRYGNEPIEKTPLPCYGESEADTEWSECEKELQAEEQAEGNTVIKSRGPLTKEKVIDVMEEEISGYIATWQKQKQPLREHRSWKIWKKKPIDRRIAMDRERAACLHSSERLNKLKKGISDDIWHTDKSVRDQCKSLEQTVIQQEEATFIIDVLQRTKQPVRPAQDMKAKKKRVKMVKDNDEISLGSDSEVATETESLNGFMEIDKEPVVHLDLTQRFDPEDPVSGRGDDMAGAEEQVDGNNDAGSDRDSELGAKVEPGAESSHSSVEAEVIDLTSDTEDRPVPRGPSPTLSPPVIKSERSVDIAPNNLHWGRSPLKDSNEEVAKWHIDVLNERDDYKRILIKLLLTMPTKEFSELRSFFVDHKSIPQLVKMIEERIELHAKGVASDQDALGADEILRLYLCWVERNSEHFNHVLNNGVWGFKSEIQRGSVHTVRENFRKADNKSLKDCCVFLQLLFQRHTTPILPPPTVHDLTADKESARSSGSDSSDDDLDSAMVAADSQSTPNKKRKRQVAESQNAKDIRERTRRTQIEDNARATRFLQQQSSQPGVSLERIVVNPGKKDDEEEIFINDYLADKVKPHQIDGIRFLWSSIVASTKKKADMAGCLLAHTMGLGKTMQAITFLITIAEACADEKRRVQIPKTLREQRTLIICPSSLIFNWEGEFGMWDKHGSFGGLWSIDSLMTVPARLKTIHRWYEKTGILLISYDLVRTIIENKPNKKASTAEALVTLYDAARKLLLEGTSLIVADEAHHVKNLNSGIAQAVKLFKTTSRIALTGSPLSNNLTEYFSMIEWISPGYLGDQVEFKALYVEPIEQGNSSDCTGEERRLARRKLRALQDILDPKIHRRDVTVLKGNLKPKIEFMIKIPLTDVQFEAYIAFINLFCRKEGNINNAKLWAWIHKLGLLCSHPLPFWNTLMEDNQGDRSPKVKDLNETHEPSTESNDLANMDEAELAPVEIPSDLKDTLRKLFASVKNPLEYPGHSNKSALLLQLLKFCMKKGDKILVFSQSIPTLDFLGSLLFLNNIKFFRLDGKTKMKHRPEMIKSFNKAGSKYDVFLISTKAGGLGFNLPGANRVVIYDFSFNPTHEEQAIGRAYRLGQTKPVFVYRFISAGTFEENMNNNTVFKTQLAYRVVEKKNIKAKATRQNEWLRDPKRAKQDDLSEHRGKDGILDQVLDTPAGQSSICGISTSEVLQQEHEEIWTPEDEAEVKQLVADEQRRFADPIGWLAESRQRQSVLDQVSEQRLVVDTAARARAAQGPVMGPPKPKIPYVLPPSTFQERPRQTFGGVPNVNGLPSNLPSSTAPVQGRAIDLSVRTPYPVTPGVQPPDTPKSRPLSSSVQLARPMTPKAATTLATTQATLGETPKTTNRLTLKFKPRPDSPATLRKESPATGNPKQAPANGAPSPATASINESSQKLTNGTHPLVPPAVRGSLKASENNSPSKGVTGEFNWIGGGKK
ncbi:hypothetical protein E2P81_ATG06681 [Venturia nashicola]|uniref:Uncharacterized protein n=1 Tax=Venturia nashicola TaxID=86259 RepID=A0A4Z1NUE1_9PEZI|nr:hypothetical protein E6O75_ATG06852 [Venturia nashicola]TLD30028.1 hypothetical protein E2P81_ATG06681 [Venturia nashicola]